MQITSRLATPEDLGVLMPMYRALEAEQAELRSMWPLADGLPEPVDTAFKELLDEPGSIMVIGELDDVPLGFGYGRAEDLLPQADGARVAVIYLIFTDAEARGVGIGDAMVNQMMDHFRSQGIDRFDARVSPGHRNAKNFFEAHGFSARIITMYHRDDGESP